MAKAKTLAALAGLAGLAYAMRNKGDKDDAGDQKTSSYTGDTKKVAASDDRMSNEDYIKSRMQKAPEAEKGSTQSDVLKALTTTKEAPNDKAGNQGVIPPKSSGKSAVAKQAPSDPRNLEAGMSRGTRTVSPSASTTSSSKEGMKNYVPRRTSAAPATSSTSTPVATTTKISDVPKSTANKFEHEMPISRFFKNVREAGNRGNPDVKMASGGMTASRRGDGIAQRGKTRGKMC